MRLSHQQSIRAADTTSQLSDDIEVEGICPSCRLAINKDTGRLNLQTRAKRQESRDESSASESVAQPQSRACDDDNDDEDEADATNEDCLEDEGDEAESSSDSSASEDSSDGEEEENDPKIWPEGSAKVMRKHVSMLDDFHTFLLF
ncbi:unnamed protein product [Trichogramma brassicae]|uniref:Uncharacterized protein n=1 Tax=Trichogramma brassicae TaxID=86971 RepID=A0A6H5J5I5_9HYME|nr:unnamed protein product [Trichogramma brassicae]